MEAANSSFPLTPNGILLSRSSSEEAVTYLPFIYRGTLFFPIRVSRRPSSPASLATRESTSEHRLSACVVDVLAHLDRLGPTPALVLLFQQEYVLVS